MTTLLLTGAGGLVGSRLLPRLAADGDDCRALVRRDLALPEGTTAVRGDLGEPDSLRQAVEGVDAVVHLAALFRTGDEAAIWRANLDGTRNLIGAVPALGRAARRAGVPGGVCRLGPAASSPRSDRSELLGPPSVLPDVGTTRVVG